MRLSVVLVTIAFAATALSYVAPTANAVGTCTSLTDPHCGHLFCYGYSWSYPDYYYRCQTYVDFPCQYCRPIEGLPLP